MVIRELTPYSRNGARISMRALISSVRSSGLAAICRVIYQDMCVVRRQRRRELCLHSTAEFWHWCRCHVIAAGQKPGTC